ncbi:Lrp/AsnC family transcriptional regulator [uncultured Litoreibacter sp.]|uniref:Lrp/AsnC family transcriptional regulator n=1 Tax=uncultured Litoreibacter sp. TaxID=1392394 RepID=UPI00260E69AA|nr:Lrp/AsnC family transcriptional regulator [uncultured Litoreibacter sp.]
MDKTLDDYDQAILRVLAAEGRISITDLAGQINLSNTPTQARVKRLEKDGIITGYKAMLDPVKLGLDHIAFVEVKLDDTREAALSAFNAAVMAVPEVEECHMTASRFDYILKVRTSSMKAYRQVLGEQISSLPHVSNTSTHVVMEAVKEELI